MGSKDLELWALIYGVNRGRIKAIHVEFGILDARNGAFEGMKLCDDDYGKITAQERVCKDTLELWRSNV
jgi:hypothetical protein